MGRVPRTGSRSRPGRMPRRPPPLRSRYSGIPGPQATRAGQADHRPRREGPGTHSERSLRGQDDRHPDIVRGVQRGPEKRRLFRNRQVVQAGARRPLLRPQIRVPRLPRGRTQFRTRDHRSRMCGSGGPEVFGPGGRHGVPRLGGFRRHDRLRQIRYRHAHARKDRGIPGTLPGRSVQREDGTGNPRRKEGRGQRGRHGETAREERTRDARRTCVRQARRTARTGDAQHPGMQGIRDRERLCRNENARQRAQRRDLL